jgi:hypothetical protein
MANPTQVGRIPIRPARLLRMTLLAVFVAAVAGCGPRVIVMKNPTTGELIQCHGQSTGLSRAAEVAWARDCAEGYQAAGWVRMN